jgi:hypothetical protein
LVKSGDIIFLKLVLFEEEEDVAEEMGEKHKGNQQQREKEFVSHLPILYEKLIECMVVEKKKQ